MPDRVAFYVDGYNLYHALLGLKSPHLKWLDLKTLAETIIQQKSETLVSVHLFTALAHHMSDQSKVIRHQAYLDALEIRGVKHTLGFFKTHRANCRRCGNGWNESEEKETDTNIATQLVIDAFDDVFDVAYVLSSDADMKPPIEFIKKRFTNSKKIVTVAAPTMRHSASILRWADRKIQLNRNHIEKSLLPQQLVGSGGQPKVIRPTEYDPPTNQVTNPPLVKPKIPAFEMLTNNPAQPQQKVADVFRISRTETFEVTLTADLHAGDVLLIKP